MRHALPAALAAQDQQDIAILEARLEAIFFARHLQSHVHFQEFMARVLAPIGGEQ